MRAKIQKISRYAPSIFQGRIDFAAHRGVSLTLEHPSERMLARIVAFALIALAVVYVYFVGASILNVIARKDALKQIATLAGAVASLEREYFAASGSIGPENGARLGLIPVRNIVYVHRAEGRVADTITSDAI